MVREGEPREARRHQYILCIALRVPEQDSVSVLVRLVRGKYNCVLERDPFVCRANCGKKDIAIHRELREKDGYW